MGKRLCLFLAVLFVSVGIAFAQTQVNGTVISSEDGEPVVGASVIVVGTKTGTVTDVDGKFSLNVPTGSKITVNYIGMQSQTVVAKANMKITMKAEAKALEEVIVTGYGNVKKSSFTGSAATMNTKGLEDVPVVSVEDKLAGGVSGVTITSKSSSPGGTSSIRIRGMGSINAGNDPLIVIDGTPVNSGNLSEFDYSSAGTNILSTINSNDIESMTVIKDAAAASLYGSRAANGVIVITTKSGKTGKTQVDFRSDWGFSNMAINYRPQLNGDDRRAVLLKGLENYYIYNQGQTAAQAAASAAGDIDDYAPLPGKGQTWTDWKKLLFRTGHHQNYQASVSGGSESTRFYASLAYTNQDGIVANTGLKRYTGNANLTHKFGHFNVDVTTLFSKMKQNLANEGNSYIAPTINYAFLQNPSTRPFDNKGGYNMKIGRVQRNPLYEQLHNSDVNNVIRSLNTLKLTWHIWDGLSASGKLAYDYTAGTEDVLWDRYSGDGGSVNGSLQRLKNEIRQLNSQFQLNYIKSFGLHNVDALVGYETENFQYGYDFIKAQDYPGELYEIGNAGTTNASSNKSQSKLLSYLGRVNYNYNNRYYASVSYRRDGSSRLSKDNRWGDFWSLSGSWRFGEEKFMEPVNGVVTDGKIRLSYGVNGTQPSSYYGYLNTYSYGEFYNGVSGIGIVGVANPDLKWEKNETFNVGLDLTFLEKYNLTFDYYTRTTSDLIYNMPISSVPGYYGTSYQTVMPTNIGSLRNNGFELTLSANWLNKKDFSWTSTLNMAHNSNKVVKLNGSDRVMDNANTVLVHQVGSPYYSYYGYEYAGVDPQTGKELYYINDGTANARNTTTDVNKAQRVVIGNNQAALQGGISNTMRWKFIDFGFTFTYQLGGDAFDYTRWQESNGGSDLYLGTVPAYYKLSDMWTGPGDTRAKLPKFQYGSVYQYSSRWLMPLDYLRLKNLSLGFSAPQQYLRPLGLNKARIYFSASNLLTFKSEKLRVDPEVPVNGIAIFETPNLRTFTFGVELGF